MRNPPGRGLNCVLDPVPNNGRKVAVVGREPLFPSHARDPPPCLTCAQPSPSADGQRKQFEFLVTRSVRKLLRVTTSTFGIPADEVLLLIAGRTPVTLADSSDSSVVDAGLFGDAEARRVPAPKRVIIRISTVPASLGALHVGESEAPCPRAQ